MSQHDTDFGLNSDPPENMTLLGSLDFGTIKDQQGRWWLCDGGSSGKDCGYNTFTRTTEDGDIVPVDGREVYMDFVVLSGEATFDLDYLRAKAGAQ